MNWVLFILVVLGVGILAAMSPLFFRRMVSLPLTLALFRRFGLLMSRLLDRISPGLDLRLLVEAGNRHFRKAFASTPYGERVLFLPFCLCPPDCPAEADPAEGMGCQSQCPGCRLGQIRLEALGLGYARVYVVPSSRLLKGRGLLPSDQFIKTKICEHRPGAALGVTCDYHLRKRLLKNHRVGDRGYPDGNGGASALQGVLLTHRNCRAATVDWEELRRRMIQTSGHPLAG